MGDDDRLQRIVAWCDAYPVKAFPPMSDDEVAAVGRLMELNGYSIGALHASWARHILDGIRKIATEKPNG